MGSLRETKTNVCSKGEPLQTDLRINGIQLVLYLTSDSGPSSDLALSSFHPSGNQPCLALPNLDTEALLGNMFLCAAIQEQRVQMLYKRYNYWNYLSNQLAPAPSSFFFKFNEFS